MPMGIKRGRGIAPLPLLTLINFFNYMDRQVVYGMTPFIAAHFHLSHFQLGWLASVNLGVFAVASLASGPISDRIGPRWVIFTGIFVWSIATIGSALSTSFPMLLFFRALVGVGEGAYGPSANSLLCADAKDGKAGRAMGIYNVGMALGGTAGLVLSAWLAPLIGWRHVFWLAGGPSMLLALLSAFVAAPKRLARPKALPARAYLLSPVFLVALLGGCMATFGASGLIFWASNLILEVRKFSVEVGSAFMGIVGILAGAGGVIVGGHTGDVLARKRAGGHALTIGVSMLAAVPFGVATLLISAHGPFLVLTFITVFLLSVYNGPGAVVVDELGPPQFAATLQAVFMFVIHVLGNSPAPTVVGYLADKTSVPTGLLLTIVAFLISGICYCWVARQQRLKPA
jgi:MFS family permease